MAAKLRKKPRSKPSKRRSKPAAAEPERRKAKKRAKAAKAKKRRAGGRPKAARTAKKTTKKKRPKRLPRKPRKRRAKKRKSQQIDGLTVLGNTLSISAAFLGGTTLTILRGETVYGRGEYCWSNVTGETFYGGRQVKYCVIDGLAIFEGDIVIGTAHEIGALKLPGKFKLPKMVIQAVRTLPTAGPGGRWPDGVVPFSIDPNLTEKNRISDAMEFFRPDTNIRFVPRTGEANFVIFMPSSGTSNSFVGMQGTSRAPGPQNINIADGENPGGIAHEICHALGLMHEHSRFDRGDFVHIRWGNIEGVSEDGLTGRDTKPASNFQMADPPGGDPNTGAVTGHENFGAYDYKSIMHYSSTAFGKQDAPGDDAPRRETIMPKAVPRPGIGQREYLSAGDIAVLNDMYPAAITTLAESSADGPAITEKFGKILIAWKGNGNDSLYTISSRDGMVFEGTVDIGERSLRSPALAVLGNRYVIAWTGVGNDKINIMQSDDGASWGPKVTLDETSPSPPALTAAGPNNNDLVLAWRGGDDRINLAWFFGGVMPPPGAPTPGKRTLNETTQSGPALCRLDPNVLLVWRGKGNNLLNAVRYSQPPIVEIPNTKVTLGERTDDRPAICSREGSVFLCWSGEGNRRINVIGSNDGGSWSNKSTAAERCVGGPSIADYGGRLIRVWTNYSPGNVLRTFLFDPP